MQKARKMAKADKEEYDWLNDPFDEKKIAEEQERARMSGASKLGVLVAVLLFVFGLFALMGLLFIGIL